MIRTLAWCTAVLVACACSSDDRASEAGEVEEAFDAGAQRRANGDSAEPTSGEVAEAVDGVADSGPTCGNGVCDADESCADCSVDCGACPECGDGTCEGEESCADCPDDCDQCPPECGDGACEGDEACGSCPDDCGECDVCGDGECQAGEDCASCESDCGPCLACGDGECEAGVEDCATCPDDCPCVCGDGICTAATEHCNACPEDCGCGLGEVCTPLDYCCEPQCGGEDGQLVVVCGLDQCGGVCDACGFNQTCAADAGQCEQVMAGCGEAGLLKADAAWATGGYCLGRNPVSPSPGPKGSLEQVATAYAHFAGALSGVGSGEPVLYYAADKNHNLKVFEWSPGPDGIAIGLKASMPVEGDVVGAPTLAADGRIYFGTTAGQLHGRKVPNADGNLPLVFEYQAKTPITASPALIGDRVVFARRSGLSLVGEQDTLPAALVALDLQGVKVWSRNPTSDTGLGDIHAAPAVMGAGADAQVVVVSTEVVIAYDVNGDTNWSWGLGEAEFSGDIVVARCGDAECVYVSGGGHVRRISAQGKLTATAEVPVGDVGPAVGADGRVYVGTTHELAVVEWQEGQAQVQVFPVPGPDGDIAWLLGSAAGQMYGAGEPGNIYQVSDSGLVKVFTLPYIVVAPPLLAGIAGKPALVVAGSGLTGVWSPK